MLVGAYPDSEGDGEVGQEDVQPDLHRQRVHEAAPLNHPAQPRVTKSYSVTFELIRTKQSAMLSGFSNDIEILPDWLAAPVSRLAW